MGMYEQGRAYIEAAALLQPFNPVLNHEAALTYHAMGKNELAQTHLDRALFNMGKRGSPVQAGPKGAGDRAGVGVGGPVSRSELDTAAISRSISCPTRSVSPQVVRPHYRALVA